MLEKFEKVIYVKFMFFLGNVFSVEDVEDFGDCVW